MSTLGFATSTDSVVALDFGTTRIGDPSIGGHDQNTVSNLEPGRLSIEFYDPTDRV